MSCNKQVILAMSCQKLPTQIEDEMVETILDTKKFMVAMVNSLSEVGMPTSIEELKPKIAEKVGFPTEDIGRREFVFFTVEARRELIDCGVIVISNGQKLELTDAGKGYTNFDWSECNVGTIVEYKMDWQERANVGIDRNTDEMRQIYGFHFVLNEEYNIVLKYGLRKLFDAGKNISPFLYDKYYSHISHCRKVEWLKEFPEVSDGSEIHLQKSMNYGVQKLDINKIGIIYSNVKWRVFSLTKESKKLNRDLKYGYQNMNEKLTQNLRNIIYKTKQIELST